MLNILKRTGMSALQLRVIALCTCVNMLDGFDILAMAYTAPAVGKLWALSPTRLGVLFSLGLTGMMAGSIFLAPLADRFGRRPMILSCLLVATLSMFAAGKSGDLFSLGCARVATGLAIGAILPCMNTMVAEYASPRSRATAVAVMQAGFAIGASLGGFLAIWLLGRFGWTAVFHAGAIMTCLLVPAVYLGMPESLAYLARKPTRAAEHAAFADVRTPLTLIAASFFSCVMVFYFLTSWVPKILVDTGFGEGQAVSAGALLTSGGILAAFALGWLSYRRSLVTVVAASTALSAGLTLAFGLLPAEPIILLTAAFLLGLAVNTTQIGIYTIIPGLFPARIRASATGLAIGIGRIGSVVGPWLAGTLLTMGWTTGQLFAAMATPYLVAVFLLLGLKKWERH